MQQTRRQRDSARLKDLAVRPDTLAVHCPRCDEVLLSALRYVSDRGYLVLLLCPDCSYERTIG